MAMAQPLTTGGATIASMVARGVRVPRTPSSIRAPPMPLDADAMDATVSLVGRVMGTTLGGAVVSGRARV